MLSRVGLDSRHSPTQKSGIVGIIKISFKPFSILKSHNNHIPGQVCGFSARKNLQNLGLKNTAKTCFSARF